MDSVAPGMLPTRPLLPGDDNQRRAKQQALRMRLLRGRWMEDLEKALRLHVREDRLGVWGIGEMSRNPFRSISSQVGGALYHRPGELRGGDGVEDLSAAMQAAGYWQVMQRQSTDLVGLRETLMRVDWSERGGLLYRPIDPDACIVDAVPEAPDEPAYLAELQLREHPETKDPAWCWEILDIRDMAAPEHKIMDAKMEEDWTDEILGPAPDGSINGYRYVYDGKPFLPVVMHHAERTGELWDAFYGIETVLGTMTVAVLLTFWVHGVKDGSFATVLLVNGQIRGVEIEGADGTRRNVISTEPGSIIEVGPIEEGAGQPTAVQLQPGFDPQKLMLAITGFEQGLAEFAGVSAADLVRTGADPRSGVSLSISREGLRDAQGRMEPQLRRGDLEAARVTAMMLNLHTGSDLPLDGVSITYPSLPLSIGERKAQTEDLTTKVDAGLMSMVDAYMALHPGITRKQATAELTRIRSENALYASPNL